VLVISTVAAESTLPSVLNVGVTPAGTAIDKFIPAIPTPLVDNAADLMTALIVLLFTAGAD
jgi:hypothetical protein